MAHGNNITPLKGGSVPQEARDAGRGVDESRAERRDDGAPAKNPKQNAPQLFDKKWQTQTADKLKNNLSTQLSNGEKKPARSENRADKHAVEPAKNQTAERRTEKAESRTAKQAEQAENKSTKQAERTENKSTKQPTETTKKLSETVKNLSGKLETNIPKNPESTARKNPEPGAARNLPGKTPFENEKTLPNRLPSEPPKNFSNKLPNEAGKNLLNQTWDKLLGAAQEHKDLAAFRDQPKRFWNDVRQMSEVRVVEHFAGGKAEPRAVSRFGDLLKQLAGKGGNLEYFLSTLPASERKVFQARYQISQTFGAGELFVGKGVALDRRGEFPARVFLSHNGKNVELPAHVVFSFLNGANADTEAARSLLNLLPNDLSAAEMSLLENASIFTNGEVLLNAKSAALLGLSLALYQNAGVSLSLTDIAAETPAPNQPHALTVPTNEQLKPKTVNQTTLENGKNVENNARRANDPNIAAALINGALAAIDKYRKSKYQPDGVSAKSDARSVNFGFGAGATGAMMGATVGCVVPLAEKSVGEVLGFAASIVNGLTDSGLRALGVDTLVSVITTGAQIFLSAASGSPTNSLPESAQKTLNPAHAIGVFEDELRQTILNRRTTVLLAS